MTGDLTHAVHLARLVESVPELHCGLCLGSGSGPPLARESSSSQSPQDPAWSTQPAPSHLGISALPIPRRWCSRGGGGSPQQASMPCSWPRGGARSSATGRRGLCPVGSTWPVGPVSQVRLRSHPPLGWLRGEARQSCRAHRPGPSSCGAAVCFQSSWAGTSEQPPPSLQRSRRGYLPQLHWRRGETEARDCVQALPGM